MSEKNIINGGEIYGIPVESTGTLVLPKEPVLGRKGVKLIVLTNSSDFGIFIAFKDSPDGTTCQAEVDKGIYLAPNGGAYESNETQLVRCEIWAIHADAGNTHNLCVQVGR